MYSDKLKQILGSVGFWNAVPTQIARKADDLRNTYGCWWRCQSRTLSEVLNSETLGRYTAGRANAYHTLFTMCSILENNKLLKIHPEYRLITSEQAQNLETDLHRVLNLPNTDPNAFNLILYHIPKGKSYLRNVLDKSTGLVRLTQIETLCLENAQHFVRIYKNFSGTGENTITIFSDIYTTHFINTLFVMLPHLMGIVSRETPQGIVVTEEDNKYNQAVKLLYEFFGVLYEIMQQGRSPLYTPEEIEATYRVLLNISTKYEALFDFTTKELNSFTAKLARARNENAQKYYKDNLERVESRIRDLEESLTELYVDKHRWERELITNKLLSEEDVKPFIDTIKTTKAIEILRTTDTKMVLRITAPLQYFQEADFEAYENNSNSNYNQTHENEPTLKKVYHKVFVTREYQILFQSIITLEIQNGYNNQILRLYAQRSTDDLTQFPNPHLYHHDCWSQAKSEIQKNIAAGNFELVVMQIVAAVQTMNVAENASFNNGFLYDIRNNPTLRKRLTFIVNTPEGSKQFNYQQMIDYEKNLEKQETIEKAKEIINDKPKEAYVQVEIPDDDANWEEPENEEN